MNGSHTSTAEIELRDLVQAPDRAEQLLREAQRYKGDIPADQPEPLFGTTYRSVVLGFKGISTPGNERLFGNRIRWVGRTFRDARANRKK